MVSRIIQRVKAIKPTCNLIIFVVALLLNAPLIYLHKEIKHNFNAKPALLRLTYQLNNQSSNQDFLDNYDDLGTGEFINSKGDIITANHVVESGHTIVLVNGKYYPATVLLRDKHNDICVIHINIKHHSHFGLNAKPQLLQQIESYGFQDNYYHPTFAHYIGQLISLDDKKYDREAGAIRVCEGNSGGPILQRHGLIGIMSARLYTGSKAKNCENYAIFTKVQAIIYDLTTANIEFDYSTHGATNDIVQVRSANI